MMWYHRSKRVLDIVISLAMIVLFAPLMFIVVILIKWDRPGLYGSVLADSPKRVGRNGKMFKMHKFRSMIMEAHKIMMQDKELKTEYDKHSGKIKTSNDMRVTKVGRLIRRFDVDELPQFFNVLKGEMSIVGPRPYHRRDLKMYAHQSQVSQRIERFLEVRPGITGLWQVSGRNMYGMKQRIEIDYKYVQQANLLGDLKIMMKTPWVILTRFGAYD